METDNIDNTEVTFELGASDLPSATPTYSAAQTFDIATGHKIDSRAAGRYLSYRLTISDNKSFRFGGFDIDVTQTGAR